MQQEELKSIYFAFATGFFHNNYFDVHEDQIEAYTQKLKRMFRGFCSKAYDFNPIAADYMTPELWLEWTWGSMMLYKDLQT